MHVSYRGRCFIARHEALVTCAYPDGKNPDGSIRYSYAFGHNGVSADATISVEDAWKLLRDDVEYRAEIVSRMLSVPQEPHQFDALVSSYYQAGNRIRPVVDLINLKRPDDAMRHFLTLNATAAGEFRPGLAKRRFQEMWLYMRADYSDRAISTEPAKLKYWNGPPATTPFVEVDFPPEAA